MQKVFIMHLCENKKKNQREQNKTKKQTTKTSRGAKLEQDAAYSRKIMLLGLGFCTTACWAGVVWGRRGSSRLDSMILPRDW